MQQARNLNRIRMRRIRRVRAKIFGTAERPRLAVFRSNRSISGQLIDDTKGSTLLSVSSRELSDAERKGKKTDQALRVGIHLAEKARDAGILAAVLDRRAHRFHGRIKAFAEGARQGGLTL